MAPMPPQPTDAASGRIAAWAGAVVVAVLAATLAGAALDMWRRRRAEKAADARQLPGWAAGMLASSYALLLPGLFAHLFVARTDFVFFGIVRNLSAYDETMVSLVRHLGHDGMWMGAILVTVYAMVIPVLKLVLLALGLLLRERNTRWARRCISVVQVISKWACPDMFAYILLTCLMRGLNKPPTLRSGTTLDLGFTCFSVFCVASTISSLGIRLPELPGEAEKARGACRIRGRVAAAAVVALSLAFVFAFAVGLVRPSMSLHMDMALLYEVRPDLKAMAPVFESVHLGDLLHKTVSVWECVASLAGWVVDGEVNAFIALVLYAGFAVLLPVVDMALILAATLADLRPDAAPATERWSAKALALSRKLRKLSMLDVSVMGSFVVVVSLASMREKGVIVDVRSGALALLVAEACRYAASGIAQRAHACHSEAAERSDEAVV